MVHPVGTSITACGAVAASTASSTTVVSRPRQHAAGSRSTMRLHPDAAIASADAERDPAPMPVARRRATGEHPHPGRRQQRHRAAESAGSRSSDARS
jgi:hypothetical protein